MFGLENPPIEDANKLLKDTTWTLEHDVFELQVWMRFLIEH